MNTFVVVQDIEDDRHSNVNMKIKAREEEINKTMQAAGTRAN